VSLPTEISLLLSIIKICISIKLTEYSCTFDSYIKIFVPSNRILLILSCGATVINICLNIISVHF
jgi:hypothetical protein